MFAPSANAANNSAHRSYYADDLEWRHHHHHMVPGAGGHMEPEGPNDQSLVWDQEQPSPPPYGGQQAPRCGAPELDQGRQSSCCPPPAPPAMQGPPPRRARS